jgi:hypothetical protein
LNPGKPVEFPVGALLGTSGIEVGSGVLVSLSSGEYVKAGKVVLFIGPLTTPADELAGASETGALDIATVLLCEDEINRLDFGADGATLETTAAEDGGGGAGVGVK